MCSRITMWGGYLIMSFVVCYLWSTQFVEESKATPIINNTYFLSIFLFPLQRRKVLKSFVQLRERESVCVCVCVFVCVRLGTRPCQARYVSLEWVHLQSHSLVSLLPWGGHKGDSCSFSNPKYSSLAGFCPYHVLHTLHDFAMGTLVA
jgi:hypothetical protein